MADTEGGVVEAPARTLQDIRSDLMQLEREVSHHYIYALWRKDRERGAEIADAAVDMHHASLKLGVFVETEAFKRLWREAVLDNPNMQ